MPSTSQSTPEPSAPEVRRRAAIRAAAELNYTALRVLQALEVIVLRPSTAPAVGAALGINPRTARRILKTLMTERYVERRGGRGRAAHEYQPTVRLLTLAAQLASRLPLIAAARGAVREVEDETDATAYVVVPCYSDVLVVAASGGGPVRGWAMLEASADAAGRILLAHRTTWRQSLMCVDPSLAVDDDVATRILEHGYEALAGARGSCGSLAVAVPADSTPIAALGVRGPSVDREDGRPQLVALLRRAAERLAAEESGA
jgi:DNA-binding IclR family transcriptional regulator